MKKRTVILIIIGVIAVLAVAGFFALPLFVRPGASNASGTSQATGSTAEVTTLTVVNTVESSGSVEAIQYESLSWETSGTAAEVYVKAGDSVKEGELLMAIDAATAPQSVIQAHVDLVEAQEALEALLNPSALEIAQAQQAVTEAEQTLKDAQQDLKYVQNPAGQSLYDAVEEAQLALDNANTNQQLERVSTDASAVKTAEDDMNLAYSRLQRAQTSMEDCIKISCGERVRVERELNSATNAYQTASDAYQTAKLKYNMNVANQVVDVETAQEDYDQAVANLNAALAGPNTLELKAAQDTVAVAEADLANKQETLDKLLNGADPNDIAAAQANVLVAQVNVDSLSITAPFDGVVLQVNARPGDSASQGEAALVLADRSQLHVDVQVDESDIGQVGLGDPATLTFDSLPGLTLNGAVTEVVPIGEVVQGLVKYTVRVIFESTDPKVLLGMTANTSIVTETIENALAVPIDAIQQDDEGEYAVRAGVGGALETVRVVSGDVQDNDLVVVTGDLQAGDIVQVGTAQPSSTGGFGGGPFGGDGGGGGGGGGSQP